jgi:hypothetical protein
MVCTAASSLYHIWFMETAAKQLPPHGWCEVYGEQLQPLAGIAMCLLAQVPSSSACERKLSAYNFVHSEERNRLRKKRARDLVNVFQNLRAVKRASKAGIVLVVMLLLHQVRRKQKVVDRMQTCDTE